jgi:RluA family pseudouridine synthase
MAATSDEAQLPVKLTVRPEESGVGLLEFVSSYLINESKIALRRLIAAGLVRVNGASAITTRIVWAEDVVSLPPGLMPSPPPAQTLPIEVLFEDADHLCINKATGAPVLPGRMGEGGEFYLSLVALLNRDAPPGGPYRRPHIVHRIDRETSGVLLVAKTLQAGRALSKQFESRQVEKAYLGILEGVLPQPELTLDIPLARMPGSVLKMAPDPRHGKPACTRLAVKEAFRHFCLVEARPLTGRQHQIRAHLAAIGYPLAVDHLYGRRPELTGADFNRILGRSAAHPRSRLLSRLPLHAAFIRYRHPGSAEFLSHRAPLPDDLQAFLELLRRTDLPR